MHPAISPQTTPVVLRVLLANKAANLKKELKDSPGSLAFQLASLVGFYQGFCTAKGWEPDLKVAAELIQ